jgi:phytoene dehydrogenase-like protein
LGLNKIETGGDFSNAWNIWYFKDYDIDKVLSRINKNDVNSMTDIIVCSIPSKVDRNPVLEDKDFMLLISLAPYMNYEYWQENRESISDRLINRINNIFKNISSNICIKETATPLTLESYTKNYKGSCFGLGSIVGQIERHVISHRCNFIDGLYIVGHWSTGGAGQGGISFSAASARHVAKLVVQDLKKKKLFLTCQI